MLLGIGLHGFMSFVPLPLPVWPAQDVNQHNGYLFALNAIHGFRLQLFFLVSGFFTAMMFRQRGLRGLIKHRAKRILLPLLIFTILLSPSHHRHHGIYGNINANRGSRRDDLGGGQVGRCRGDQPALGQGCPMPASWTPPGSLPSRGQRCLAKRKPPRHSSTAARMFTPLTTTAPPHSTAPRLWAKLQWSGCWSRAGPTLTPSVMMAAHRSLQRKRMT